MKPWKYCWVGNRSRLPTFHSFVVTILAPNKGYGLKVIKQFCSPSFIVSSVRRSPKNVDRESYLDVSLLKERIYRPLFDADPVTSATSTSLYGACTTEDSCVSAVTNIEEAEALDECDDIHQMTVNLKGLCSDSGSENESSDDDEEGVDRASLVIMIPDTNISTTAATATVAAAVAVLSTPPSSPKHASAIVAAPRTPSLAASGAKSAVVTPDLASQKYDPVDRMHRPSFLALKMKHDKQQKRQCLRSDSPFTLECGRLVSSHTIEDECESNYDEQNTPVNTVASAVSSVSAATSSTFSGFADEEEKGSECDDSFIKLPSKLQPSKQQQRGRGLSYEESAAACSESSANSIRDRVNASLNVVKADLMSADERKQHHIRLIDRLFAKPLSNLK